jgi:hypothetical protein
VGRRPVWGGTARSAEKGAFTLSHARGERGPPAGEYRLTVSLRKLPDGTVPPVNDPTPSIESHARAMLPPHYSNPDQTILTWSVTSEPRPLQLKLDSQASPAPR